MRLFQTDYTAVYFILAFWLALINSTTSMHIHNRHDIRISSEQDLVTCVLCSCIL